MDVELEIKETLRYMLLPIPFENEGDCARAIRDILASNNIDETVIPAFIRVKYEAWRNDDILDPILKRAIQAAFLASGSESEISFDEKYFEIHSSLLKKPFVSFEVSIILLSHLRLIVMLADKEKMSAAKIAIVLRSIDHRLGAISWKDIQVILRILGLVPELKMQDVQQLYLEDESLEAECFADADISDAAYQVGEVAKKLQFNNDAEFLLKKLSEEGKAHLPYLQILHYQCLISGFYDHVFPILYEFNPRGNIAGWLFGRWNNLLHTSNPILNNAKAVETLDESWARSRKANEYEQATILVKILKGLNGMGFTAAQELTSWIRRWLVRYIKINSSTIKPINPDLNSEQISSIFSAIKTRPTGTYGILEQRYVDVLASSIHTEEEGWRPRGLCDSVNVNNVSKKKLGDCDFQNSNKREVVAYEAHGGILSEIYVEGHLRTLRRSLLRRAEELESIADLEEWRLDIVFVAYGFKDDLKNEEILDGLSINLCYVTFNELLSKADVSSTGFREKFRTMFIEVINSRRTPSFIREKIKAMLETN